jgi:hypothetical protein
MYRFTPQKDEKVRKKGLAGMHIGRESLSGALYLTNQRLLFVGYIHGNVYVNEKSIALKQIREVRGGKTFFIIPNELNVTTDGNEHLRFIVHERNEWLASIRAELALAGRMQSPAEGA